MRQVLPNRRHGETFAVEWEGQRYRFGCYLVGGIVRELFVDTATEPPFAPKVGTNMWALLNDVCVMVSIMLQGGTGGHWLVERLGHFGPKDDPVPASIIGLALKRAMEIQTTRGGDYALVESVLRGEPMPDPGAVFYAAPIIVVQPDAQSHGRAIIHFGGPR